MTNQLTVHQKADNFVITILSDKSGALERTLPAHIRPERFRRNLSAAINQHPKLLSCDPSAVLNEVSKAAALGLLLDPQLGEAYLITQWSKDGDTPRLMIGYRGLIKLARQSGDISTIYAHEVCDLDRFHVALGSDKKLIHEPNYLTDRGKICMYYAVVHFRNGSTDFEPMSLRDIYAIRERSDGWRAFKSGKIKSTPWASDEGEMAKKTVIRRLMKRCPQSPELAEAFSHEDADYVDVEEIPIKPPRAKIHRTIVTAPSEAEVTDVGPEPQSSHDGPEDARSIDDVVIAYAEKLEFEIDTAKGALTLHKFINAQVKNEDGAGSWGALVEADPRLASELKAKATAKIAELK